MHRYKAVIFDLGNVIISFSHEKMYSQIAEVCGIPIEDLQELFIQDRIGMQFERGHISTEEIVSILSAKAQKKLDLPTLIKASSDIFSYRPEMIHLLKKLKAQGYPLLLLSNTNETHYKFLKNHFDFFHLFDHLILSFKVKAVKPELKIFECALEKASCQPEECYYIDDIPEYVLAAEELGIKGHVFKSPSMLLKHLQVQGILS